MSLCNLQRSVVENKCKFLRWLSGWLQHTSKMNRLWGLCVHLGAPAEDVHLKYVYGLCFIKGWLNSRAWRAAESHVSLRTPPLQRACSHAPCAEEARVPAGMTPSETTSNQNAAGKRKEGIHLNIRTAQVMVQGLRMRLRDTEGTDSAADSHTTSATTGQFVAVFMGSCGRQEECSRLRSDWWMDGSLVNKQQHFS